MKNIAFLSFKLAIFESTIAVIRKEGTERRREWKGKERKQCDGNLPGKVFLCSIVLSIVVPE